MDLPENPNTSSNQLQAKECKHIVITHGTDTLIETAKYLGFRSTAEGDATTVFLIFFFFGGVWNEGI